jgi:hypothetical protein
MESSSTSSQLIETATDDVIEIENENQKMSIQFARMFFKHYEKMCIHYPQVVLGIMSIMTILDENPRYAQCMSEEIDMIAASQYYDAYVEYGKPLLSVYRYLEKLE